jgi:Helix-turn-helix domain
MAKKLIDQDEAARILGVSPEEIGSLRDRKRLFPYRDGDQWKFKPEDVERLRDELAEEKAEHATAAGGGEESSASWQSSSMEDVELESNEDPDSILLSDVELGAAAKEGPSTIIGKPGEGPSSPDDDMVLADEPKVRPTLEGSGLTLTSTSGIGLASGIGSDVKLVASGSDVAEKPPGAGSSDKLFGSDALTLSDDELTLVEAHEPAGKSKPSAGSSIKVGAEDEESVLTAKPGSDVTLSPTDSGIMLVSPSDSGLSLDEPLALGSSAKQLLELTDEGMGSAAGRTGIGLGSGIKGDEEFQLSSADEPGDDSDSGSQVIALDSDDDLSSGMFAPVAAEGLVEEETVALPGSDAPVLTAVSTPQIGGVPFMAAPASLEAPFSGWNVMALAVCAIFLLLCGMMSYDLLRNMSSWNGPYTVNSSIMDSIGNSIGWFDK